MKNRVQILREIEKNLTYESIRFNNKQISDEIIKNAIDQYFPKIFSQQKWKEITFFTKAMKDEDFYKKIRTMVSMQLGVEMHLQEVQQRQIQKSKIQDSDSHGVEELNNKKMTRAALAKRYQQTQEQLRKDQIYVRLTPKTQQCLQWMLCNRKFPRIECKLSCNQHIEYLINYLSNKWLPGKGHNRIVLYPDVGSYLKNNLSAKDRQKVLKQPLNNYFMFTDVMVGCGIGQNGILNLHYEILEKKKDPNRPQSLVEGSAQYIQKQYSEKKQEQNSELHQNQKIINLEELGDSSKKCVMERSEEKYQSYIAVNTSKIKTPIPALAQSSAQKSIFAGALKLQSSMNNQGIHQHSNHFLSNESNLLNPNRSIYHDEESLLMGFYPLGTGNNSIGFDKKNDFNMMSLNSNSFIDIGHMHGHERFEQKRIMEAKSHLEHSQGGQQVNLQSQKKEVLPKQASKIICLQVIEKPMSPKNIKCGKQSSFVSPKKQSNRKMIQRQKQVSKSSQKERSVVEVKEQPLQQVKKHQQKLLDLRNAINLLQEAQGFNDQQVPGGNEEVSQKSLKEIKTVSIKKKTLN